MPDFPQQHQRPRYDVGVHQAPAFAAPLAPMNGPIRWLTYGLLGLPLFFFLLSATLWHFAGVGVLILIVYAAVWIWFRPSRFELDESVLRIVWPARTRAFAVASMTGVRVLSSREFQSAYGWGMRVGAGGLWGGFGQLWTPKGRLHMYISRTDEFVVIERLDGLPLMITPASGHGFAEALRARLPGAPVS